MNYEHENGFTLIEIIVAVSIFAIITLAIVDMMIIVMRTQETITRIQAVQDNARFSLELLTKELRTGTNYRADTLCASDGSEIHFMSTSGPRVYYLDPGISGKIYRATTDITDSDWCANGGHPRFNEFTGDQAFVERLVFMLQGQEPPSINDGQAMVTIILKVDPDLNLETTVVQRVRDTP